MLSVKKIWFYIQNILHMITVNKVRMILTSVGIFAAVFLFATGMVLSESYYNSNLRVLDEMEEYSAVLISDKNVVTYIDMNLDLYSQYLQARDSAVGGVAPNVLQFLNLSETSRAILAARYHGMDGKGISPSFDDHSRYIPLKEELAEGRFLNAQDIERRAPVVVIDELTAEICYPGESAIGNLLTLYVDQNKKGEDAFIRAEIIGVVRNNLFSYTAREKLKRKLEDPNKIEDEIYRINVDVYCPYGFLEDQGLLASYRSGEDIYSTYLFPDEDKYQAFVAEAKKIALQAEERSMSIEIMTPETYRGDLKAEFADMRQTLNMATLLLCVISGISIMSITFFAVKERIAEIGIRKAFGAGRMDILFQIVIEMVILALGVSLFALLGSMMFCKAFEPYFQSSVLATFRIGIDNSRLFLPMTVGVLEAAICSLIPAWYASRIKVVDALRFE